MLLFDHFWSRGKVEEAEVVRRISEAAGREDAAAALERNRLRPSDPLLAHGLPEAQVDDLRQRLAVIPELVEACLSRRELSDPARATSLPARVEDVPAPGPPCQSRGSGNGPTRQCAGATAHSRRRLAGWDRCDGGGVRQRDPFFKRARKVPGAVLLERV